ncbi:hypothetical protein RIR_jg11592.t1 [Rhizophagus irregularis DAOM 181602=DAOM 197198]|uniref:Uncharacterized protein n=1 Tax=Rhizophagus irregularis (strain DAOM 181602 / DAOM 197198 / MUCL 43194) TaxID=747089 RepID=U9TEW5_RHIID|nr:hypothetical protein RIR_jg11592.t1 [Rhizophagus irregularis DAOM 181602=DAOM 197198]
MIFESNLVRFGFDSWESLYKIAHEDCGRLQEKEIPNLKLFSLKSILSMIAKFHTLLVRIKRFDGFNSSIRVFTSFHSCLSLNLEPLQCSKPAHDSCILCQRWRQLVLRSCNRMERSLLSEYNINKSVDDEATVDDEVTEEENGCSLCCLKEHKKNEEFVLWQKQYVVLFPLGNGRKNLATTSSIPNLIIIFVFNLSLSKDL